MGKKKKYYTVWEGKTPGVYDNWRKCKAQIDGYTGAVYKSFPSEGEAMRAYQDSAWNYVGKNAKKAVRTTIPVLENLNIIKNSLSVDAACSGNPGELEYRGVYIQTGEEVFRQGPFERGTNNIGEFLALVHGLALLKQKGMAIPIYSDSATAISWVKKKKVKTKLEQGPENMSLFYMIERAEKWLEDNTYTTNIIKWDTRNWGEIPADFGRK